MLDGWGRREGDARSLEELVARAPGSSEGNPDHRSPKGRPARASPQAKPAAVPL